MLRGSDDNVMKELPVTVYIQGDRPAWRRFELLVRLPRANALVWWRTEEEPCCPRRPPSLEVLCWQESRRIPPSVR